MRIILFGFCLLSLTSTAKAPVLTADELVHPPANVIRTCCAFGVDLSVARIPFVKKTDIISVNDMGMHHYLGGKEEGNGIIYTKRGGFIDLGHLRDYADWTVYIYNVILANKDTQDQVVLNLDSEGGAKTIILQNLTGLDRRSISELAAKIAYDLSVWHEIATWYGTSYLPMVPERYSSFSPEDLYSNLLGTKLALQAIESDLEYNEAMTHILAEALDSLEAVHSAEQTYIAMEQVEDIWWTRKKALPSSKVLLVRYLGTDSYLIPWLLPDDEKSNSYVTLYKSDHALSAFYEFSVTLSKRLFLDKMDSTQHNIKITQNDFDWIIDQVKDDQKIIELKSAIRIQKANMRKERRQHDSLWNQV